MRGLQKFNMPNTNEREQQIIDFLAANGFGDAVRIDLGGDASTRRYERLQQNGKNYILMDAPQGADLIDGTRWHLQMNEAERCATGHDAMRWRAGSRMEAFLCINGWLQSQGFSVSRVFAYDVVQGFALLEDFGTEQYWHLLEQTGVSDAQQLTMYEAATDALIKLDQTEPPAITEYENLRWSLPSFDKLVITTEAEMFLEWYVGKHSGLAITIEMTVAYNDAWSKIANLLTSRMDRLVTRDFQSPNLMWLPQRDGYKRAGILDYQDAVLSHPAFNLMFLLNDPRRDVPENIQQAMLDRYFAATGFDRIDFMQHYAVHQALQAFRIAGLFCRLNIRDNKPHFMMHVPRMERYIRKALQNPACAALRDWFKTYMPEFLNA